MNGYAELARTLAATFAPPPSPECVAGSGADTHQGNLVTLNQFRIV